MGASGLADVVILVRHGATEWSQSGRHTGRSDIPLADAGREQAQALATVLDAGAFGRLLCSPMLRARETCELAGCGERAQFSDDLVEWDYGEYEGLTTPEIRERRPDWFLWRDGCPGGESPEQVAARADRVLSWILQGDGEATAIFAHGHLLRVLAARWIELPAAGGSRLALDAGRLGVLGHEREVRVIRGWNAVRLDG